MITGPAAFARRTILAASAATAFASMLPAFAQAPQTASRLKGRKLIDVHHHYNPPAYKTFVNNWNAANGQKPQGGPLGEWSVENALRILDENDTQTAILSLTPGGGGWYAQTDAERGRIARECNIYGAKIASDHKGRFGLFAALPMPDVDGSLKEAVYALDTLKADGVSMLTNFGTTWPGEPAYDTLWQELNRRKATVYFHPVTGNCCTNVVSNIGDTLLEYPYDTGRAILSLLFSGAFAKYRDINWIFSHGGAAIPVLAGRINRLSRQRAQMEARGTGGVDYAPNGIDFELKRLYYETANAFYPPAMSALAAYVPMSQVLFGTDWPFLAPLETAEGLEKLGLPADVLAAIERGNALKMFPRLA